MFPIINIVMPNWGVYRQIKKKEMKKLSILGLLLVLSIVFFSCSKSDDDVNEDEKEYSATDETQPEKPNSSSQKPRIKNLKVSYRSSGSKVSSNVNATATFQAETPDDAPITSATVSCEGKSATARLSLGTYTASLILPGKAYGTTYTLKATVTNKYGSYTSSVSFKRPK